MGNAERTRDELVRFLGTISRAGQDLEGVADDQNLIDAGIIDSLATVQIILHLEQSHAVDLRVADIDTDELTSIAGILRSIERAGRR